MKSFSRMSVLLFVINLLRLLDQFTNHKTPFINLSCVINSINYKAHDSLCLLKLNREGAHVRISRCFLRLKFSNCLRMV